MTAPKRWSGRRKDIDGIGSPSGRPVASSDRAEAAVERHQRDRVQRGRRAVVSPFSVRAIFWLDKWNLLHLVEGHLTRHRMGRVVWVEAWFANAAAFERALRRHRHGPAAGEGRTCVSLVVRFSAMRIFAPFCGLVRGGDGSIAFHEIIAQVGHAPRS